MGTGARWGLSSKADIGAHGDWGMGAGSGFNSSVGCAAVGSRKEKKLCERECLWWCPRRFGLENALVSCASWCWWNWVSDDGGLPPNLNPCPSGVRGGSVLRTSTLDPAAGMVDTGASTSSDTS